MVKFPVSNIDIDYDRLNSYKRLLIELNEVVNR